VKILPKWLECWQIPRRNFGNYQFVAFILKFIPRLSAASDVIFATNVQNLLSWAEDSRWLEATAKQVGPLTLGSGGGTLVHATSEKNWELITQSGYFRPAMELSAKLGNVVYFFQNDDSGSIGDSRAFVQTFYRGLAVQKKFGDGVSVMGTYKSAGLFDLDDPASQKIIENLKPRVRELQRTFNEESPFEDWQTKIPGETFDSCIPYILLYKLFPSIQCIKGTVVSSLSGFAGKKLQIFCSTCPVPHLEFQIDDRIKLNDQCRGGC